MIFVILMFDFLINLIEGFSIPTFAHHHEAYDLFEWFNRPCSIILWEL